MHISVAQLYIEIKAQQSMCVGVCSLQALFIKPIGGVDTEIIASTREVQYKDVIRRGDIAAIVMP